MLADEVDPTRRTDDADAVALLGGLGDGGGQRIDQVVRIEGVGRGSPGHAVPSGASSRRSQPGLNSRIRCWRRYGCSPSASQSSSMPSPGASGIST